MKRVLVVPWSTAPTKSATGRLHFLVSGRRRDPARLLRLRRGRQESRDQELVQAGAGHAADQGPDDRNPEIGIPGLVAERTAVAGEEAGESRTEVAGRVDRIPGVGAPRHADA